MAKKPTYEERVNPSQEILAQRLTRLQTLTYLNQIISSSLEIEKVLTEIAKATARLMDAQIVTIWKADDETQTLELKAFSDEKMHEDFRVRKMGFNRGGAGLVATHRQPINIPDVFVDKRIVNHDWWKTHGLKSFFGYPIFLEQTLVAVLGLGCEKPLPLEPEDQALLDNLVAQAAIAIKNARLFQEIRRLSISDGLTGVSNRRYFDEQFDKEWRRNQRKNLPIGVIMIDIDFFKRYNDTYGHQAGDECLKQVAETLQKSLRRPGDLLARYGGEEFVALLPEIDIEDTAEIAYAMRQAILELSIPHRGSKVDKNLTISLGVAGGQLNEFRTPEDLLSKADQALYEAKNGGRNQIALAQNSDDK